MSKKQMMEMEEESKNKEKKLFDAMNTSISKHEQVQAKSLKVGDILVGDEDDKWDIAGYAERIELEDSETDRLQINIRFNNDYLSRPFEKDEMVWVAVPL
jgi:hypothetical protein